MVTLRFSLVALLLLAQWRACDSASDDYQFFQVEMNLFATNGTSFWHVFSNQTDRSTGTVKFTLAGPHKLINSSLSALNFTATPFKLAFSALVQKQCIVLVLVDQQLNYEIWQIIKSANVRSAITELNPPFVVKILSESTNCNLDLAESGNLRFFQLLETLFAANQPLTSVLSNNTDLYFVGNDSLLRMDFTKGVKDNNFTEFVQLNRSFSDEQILALHQDGEYVLVRNANGTQSCRINSLQFMQITKECKQISYSYKRQAMERAIFPDRDKLGSDYDQATTPAKAGSTVLIMVVSIVVTVIIILLIYIVAAKFLCQDSVASIPFSGLTSKFVGKLKSSSSIKTIKSSEEKLKTRQ